MQNLFDTDVQMQKNKVLTAVARLAFDNKLDVFNMNAIPNELVPEDSEQQREIIGEYVKLAANSDHEHVVNVIPSACDACPFDEMIVTDNCRGCVAHHCANNCPRDAITFGPDRHAQIDPTLCIRCGRCATSCQYGAIVRAKRPCMEACSAKAMGKDPETGRARIDYDKCISCGQCVAHCPFGAIVDKSFITDTIRMILDSENNTKYKVYAIVAPAIASQYDKVSVEQVVSGIRQLGFDTVVEAAWAGDIVALLESKELVEKGFLTSSCCPGFVDYIHKNFPDIVPEISHNYSPMTHLSKTIKESDPTSKTVFIGPCIAKKNEKSWFNEDVDAVLTFEELEALFNAKDIVLSELEGTQLDNATYFGRIFARSGGLTEAVAQALKEHNITESDFKADPIVCNGLRECDTALRRHLAGKLPNNFIEGMCCDGGCIGGAGCINHTPKDVHSVNKHGKASIKETLKESVAVVDEFFGK